MSLNTVKALLIARVFIKIITFHREVGGRLLEARVLKYYIQTTKTYCLSLMSTILDSRMGILDSRMGLAIQNSCIRSTQLGTDGSVHFSNETLRTIFENYLRDTYLALSPIHLHCDSLPYRQSTRFAGSLATKCNAIKLNLLCI